MIDYSLAGIMKKMYKGVTLVELMITLAVLAILITIAYPQYHAQVVKSRRVDAKAVLGKLAMAQERHYAMFGSYAKSIAELNYGPDGTKDNEGDEVFDDTFAYERATAELDHNGDGSFDYYNVELVSNGSGFEFKVTAKGSQADDTDCLTYTINHLGEKNCN